MSLLLYLHFIPLVKKQHGKKDKYVKVCKFQNQNYLNKRYLACKLKIVVQKILDLQSIQYTSVIFQETLSQL